MACAIAIPVLLMIASLAVDAGYLFIMRNKLQANVDSVALEIASHGSITEVRAISFVKEKTLKKAGERAMQMGQLNLLDADDDRAVVISDIEVGEWDPQTRTFSSTPPFRLINAVHVTGEFSVERGNAVQAFFRTLFDIDVTVRADTIAVIPPVPTIHTLDESRSASFAMTGSADLDTHDVWTNSTAGDSVSIELGPLGSFGGVRTYTAGGSRSPGRISKDMYALKDLLAEERDPGYVSCQDVRGGSRVHTACQTFRDTVLDRPGQPVVVHPGIYQGGLTILNARSVTLMPGTYVFKDGPLKLEAGLDKARIEGRDVMLYFTGEDAALEVAGGTLSLSGLKTGPYQGYVLFSNRSTTSGETHRIGYGGRMESLGTIYAPSNDFVFDGTLDGSCHSLCLVARNITINGGALDIASMQPIKGFGTGSGFPYPPALHPSLIPFLRARQG
ncbi:MAG: hypothetical protein WBF53_11595 [Litorimonas sp.]